MIESGGTLLVSFYSKAGRGFVYGFRWPRRTWAEDYLRIVAPRLDPVIADLICSQGPRLYVEAVAMPGFSAHLPSLFAQHCWDPITDHPISESSSESSSERGGTSASASDAGSGSDRASEAGGSSSDEDERSVCPVCESNRGCHVCCQELASEEESGEEGGDLAAAAWRW